MIDGEKFGDLGIDGMLIVKLKLGKQRVLTGR
jgi:hypothetical protein